MRNPVDADRIRALAKELARVTRQETTLHLTGGATAVIEGWRASTVDVALRLEPESDELLRRSKIERGFAQDLDDVASMVSAGLIDPERAQALFAEIEPELFRYPAIDAKAFRVKVARALVAAS